MSATVGAVIAKLSKFLIDNPEFAKALDKLIDACEKDPSNKEKILGPSAKFIDALASSYIRTLVRAAEHPERV